VKAGTPAAQRSKRTGRQFGASDRLFFGRESARTLYRTLARFELGAIPEGAEVELEVTWRP